jgi:hypothetical protein
MSTSGPHVSQPAEAAPAVLPRRFEFERDTFAFANELLWEYRFDPATGRTRFARRVPRPDYAHHCFVLVRTARQFLDHAWFDPARPPVADGAYRRLVRQVVARNPRVCCADARRVIIPAYEGLRAFSRAHEALLKAACGGAWQSYCLRSHWRMVFPVSRRHQERTARQLVAGLEQGRSPIAHLVRFPILTINHGVVVFGMQESGPAIRFRVYDPNVPAQPADLTYDRDSRTFLFPANQYWAGGRVDVIEIYRTWLL